MSSTIAQAPKGGRAERRAPRRSCIVLATNGSAEADAALRFAAALARREELPLRAVTVLEPLPVLPLQTVAAGYPTQIEAERSEQILKGVRAHLAANGAHESVDTTMLVGSPGATIADAGREWGAECIVLGAGQHGALERMLAGDTVIRVLRHAVVPVIAVPSSAGGLPCNGVAGIDFSPASVAAARSAAALIGNGVLHLVHVSPDVDLPATDPDTWSKIYETGALELLGKLAAELCAANTELHITIEILRGHAPTMLLDHATSLSADLIAVGQHSHGLVDRLLFGSVSSAMVRGSQTSVLVAPLAAAT
jgi:nucleotide-binding universal stress UspA family protein